MRQLYIVLRVRTKVQLPLAEAVGIVASSPDEIYTASAKDALQRQWPHIPLTEFRILQISGLEYMGLFEGKLRHESIKFLSGAPDK